MRWRIERDYQELKQENRARALRGAWMAGQYLQPAGLDSQVGGNMIVVDTLVHNFLHRTGILARLTAAHPYGPACYRPGACVDGIWAVSDRIDTRQFNRSFPAVFPRFVQHAIRRGARHVGGIEGVAAPAQARQPARGAPVPSTDKLVARATAFSREGCTPTTADLAAWLNAAVVAP